MKAVCTEAGMFALRERRVHVTQDDFELACAKVMNKAEDGNVSLKKLWREEEREGGRGSSTIIRCNELLVSKRSRETEWSLETSRSPGTTTRTTIRRRLMARGLDLERTRR